MAILTTKPLNDGVITNLYDATHPVMGDGIVIETIKVYQDKEPEADTPTSVRFFPKDIKNGALYSGQRVFGQGELLDECADAWELEDVEPHEIKDVDDYLSVNDFNEFHDWDWSTAKVERSDIDATRWRLHVKIRHTETRGRRRLIKETKWTWTTKWIQAPSQETAEAALRTSFKKEFFDKFQGCKMFMKSPKRRFNHNNS